jgi:hypothetical protein
MQLEIALDDPAHAEGLRHRLRQVTTNLGVDCTLTAVDADLL